MNKVLLSNYTITDLENTITKILKQIIFEQSYLNDSATNELVTRQEAAKILKISLPTLHNWTKNGLLSCYKVSSRVRYKRSEIMELFNSDDLNKFSRAM